jgi:hypothetical protein
LFVGGTTDTDQYIQNLSGVGFMEELGPRQGTFERRFQQNGAPAHVSQTAID